jgi:hypothetical protein
VFKPGGRPTCHSAVINTIIEKPTKKADVIKRGMPSSRRRSLQHRNQVAGYAVMISGNASHGSHSHE